MTTTAILKAMEADKTIAQALRDEMKKQRLTQQELADRAGMPQSSVARVLAAKRGKISADLTKMLDALDLELVVRSKAK